MRKISCLALKLTRYNVKKIKKFLLIDEKVYLFFFFNYLGFVFVGNASGH